MMLSCTQYVNHVTYLVACAFMCIYVYVLYLIKLYSEATQQIQHYMTLGAYCLCTVCFTLSYIAS